MDKGSKRRINENKFAHWEELSGGGRRDYFDVPGRHGQKARYVKEVNADEETLTFFQEIYDEKGVLIEVHEKFPINKGHRRAKEG